MISIDAAAVARAWCVYHLHFHDGATYRPMFAGLSRVADLLHLTEARANSEAAQLCADGRTVNVTIESLHHTQADASATRDKKLLYCNTHGKQLSASRGKRVLCVTTDVMYDSAQQAADDNGVSKSAMSEHLSGRHMQLRGKVYRRIPDDT